MKPIRVLQVFTVLNRGGAETMVMNYYRHMDRSKVQFDFLVHRDEPGAYEEEIKELGGTIYRLPPIHPKSFHTYKIQVKNFLKQHPEYKIIHGHLSELGYFIYKEAKKQGVPVIICHAHNSKMDLDLKAPFRWWWKHACRKYTTHQFTCSAESAKWLFGSKGGRHAIQMNNAVDTKLFKFDCNVARQVRMELGVDNKVVFGHVGRFNIQKNHPFLIQTFAQLNRRQPDSVLVLVGQGELEEEIRNQVRALGLEQCVIFLGMRTDVHRVMQAFDFFLFPSLFEGLPVTLVEAQMSGVTCLISDQISKAVDMRIGLLHYIPIKNSKVWVNEIEKQIHVIDWIRRRRQAARMCQEKKSYDIKNEVKHIQDFYIEHHA